MNSKNRFGKTAPPSALDASFRKRSSWEVLAGDDGEGTVAGEL
jgi:hypothetical protein